MIFESLTVFFLLSKKQPHYLAGVPFYTFCAMSTLMLALFSADPQAAETPALVIGVSESTGNILKDTDLTRGEELSLQAAIERALNKSPSIVLLKNNLRTSEINYQNAWDTMFLPAINLKFAQDSKKTVTHLGGRAADLKNNDLDERGYPTSSAYLELGKYRLFNFFKDWTSYQQARLDWENTQKAYSESIRSIRVDVTTKFFSYKTRMEKLESAKRSVDISEAILMNVKSQVRKGDAKEQDINSAQVDVLNARNEFNKLQTTSKTAFWDLNLALGDPVDTPYRIKEEIRFVPLKLSLEQAIKIYEENAPSKRNSAVALRKAELALELAEKDRIPLPSIDFSGIKIGVANTFHGATPTYANDGGSSKNMDISASVSFTIPILGPGGFLKIRTVEASRIARDNAEIGYREQIRKDHIAIFNAINGIKENELAIDNAKQAFINSQKILDDLFSKIGSQTTNRLEIRDAIKTARESDLSLADSIQGHLASKLGLAQTLGLDHLPGDIY